MKSSFIVLMLFATFSFAQDNNPAASSDHSKQKKGFVTVQGCVSRSSGDYVLVKQNPAMTYELQATGKIRLREYLGQRVEVTGREGPTMSSSSDALNKTGSASPVTISVSAVKTIADACSQH